MTIRRTVYLGLALLAVVAVTVHGQSTAPQAASQLFERARMLEETSSRNLTDAIAIYQQVAARRTDNPQLAAQAQLRIGLLYDRLGRTSEARRAFEAVVSQHGSQTKVAAEARAHLQTDEASNVGAAGGGGPRLERRLHTTEVSLSPDGRTLALYRLALLDLASGQTTQLDPAFSVPDGSGPDGRYEDAEWPRVSHDGKQLAYEWYVWDTKKWNSQLRVISTAPGGKPRTLVDNEEFTYFGPVGWSPDGKRILATITLNDQTNVLAWVSVADGVVTRLASLGWRQYGHASLSPTGRYVAYSAINTDPAGPLSGDARRQLERHIYVQATDGSAPTELTLTADIKDSSPVWTPDETAILFLSNRLGSFGIWRIPVKDGKSAGPPALIRGNTGEVDLFGLTPAGKLFYRSSTDVQTVSVVAVSRDAAPNAVVKNVVNGSAVSWSADGKFMAYFRPPTDAGNDRKLIVHSVETGEERSYSHDGLQTMAARWFRDGQRLLVGIASKPAEEARFLSSRSPLYVLDRQSGAWTPVLPADPQRGPAYLGPDDRTVYYILYGESSMKIAKFDLVTAATTQVFDFGTLPKGEHGVGNLSPDGRTWALRSRIGTDAHLFVVALDSGSYRDLYHGPGANVMTGLEWSGDSRTIYWAERAGAAKDAPQRLRIMQIAAAGGSVQFSGIELDGERAAYPEISPDGTRVALSQYERQHELWSLSLGFTKAGR